MKACFKCGESKSLDEFYKHPKMGDGYLGKCKECTKKDSNKHRSENLESCRSYDRERSVLPHRAELRRKVSKTWVEDGRQSASQQRYKDKYPDRYTAHNILNSAKRDGKILMPNACSVCGRETTRLEAHHEDYTKPLDVQWMCVSCHSDTRREYPRLENEEITHRNLALF